jgi:hypothetical protein
MRILPVLFFAAILLGGCASPQARLFQDDEGSGGGFGRNSAEARINHLLSEGQFAEQAPGLHPIPNPADA